MCKYLAFTGALSSNFKPLWCICVLTNWSSRQKLYRSWSMFDAAMLSNKESNHVHTGRRPMIGQSHLCTMQQVCIERILGAFCHAELAFDRYDRVSDDIFGHSWKTFSRVCFISLKVPFTQKHRPYEARSWGKVMEMPGIDPSTSRTQSARSTNWATSPVENHCQYLERENPLYTVCCTNIQRSTYNSNLEMHTCIKRPNEEKGDIVAK